MAAYTNFPTQNPAFPTEVEKEERTLGFTDTLDVVRQREASGNLPDESPEAPVQNPRPYRNLRGGR